MADARPFADGWRASAVTSAANTAAATQETAGHTPGPAVSRRADTSLLVPEASATGTRSTPIAGRVRADALRLLGCVRMATVRQMAQVITAEGSDGRSYVRRAMQQLRTQGLAETNGKYGRDPIWNLTSAGLKALAAGNELPPRPRAGTGARGIRAGFGPHGIAVTETILAYGGRHHLTGWQVEVNHAIKAIGLSFSTDAVLALPTATSEVRLFEVDNGTMTRARLAKEVWDYERYAGHRVWEGARGTIGRSYDFWARHRYTRSRHFPTLHVVLTGLPEHLLQRRLEALARDVECITIAVLATTLPRLQRGEPWYELAVDDYPRRRARYPQVSSR
ncbi:replication-relaxation family protein [Streptomyces chrestomyceticus]|uniref:Replication-relaxation family protein n=1 Tax=Streptomyces chrestomyceticus TaxID=68185 RepID=A0ABU7X1P6_9ACTN